jgi:molecular chaperone DnaJ
VAAVEHDYYEVLGVPRDADDETIRRAFQELAREWHPDVADTPDAARRFRELAEAYTVLSNRETRLQYDREGYVDEVPAEAPPETVRGDDIRTEVQLRSFEAAEGTRRLLAFHATVRCPACMGRGAVALPDPECNTCQGTGRRRSALQLYFEELRHSGVCPDCMGEPCARCGGKGTVEAERKIRLRIPAGVADGALLRVSGDGNDAGARSIPGDLLVRVHVHPAPDDPRIVRYLAFVLLLVAIVMLALYVLR